MLTYILKQVVEDIQIFFKFIDDNNQNGSTFGQTYSGADLHTTNTTSQVDYQVYLKVNAGTVFINNDSQLTITLMEILA
jgi:hypothetical protein